MLMKPKIHLYKGDLPDHLEFQKSVAIDTEAMGLRPARDRLCLVQLSTGDGVCHLVQFDRSYEAPNLKKLLTNPQILKIFHYARFDVAILSYYLGINIDNIYCTKIASKLSRTFTDRHSLRDLCRDLLNVDISKEQQTSDWGASTLKTEQQEYAATDVLYLHNLKEKLDLLLEREMRTEIATQCFKFLPTCTTLDLLGYEDLGIFRH